MPIKVEHRPLLQRKAKKRLKPFLENTCIGKVIRPHQEMVLKFLDEVIVDQKFEDEDDLQEALNTWVEFAKENGLEVHHEWDSINLHSAEAFIAFAGGLSGPFVVGLIKSLEDL